MNNLRNLGIRLHSYANGTTREKTTPTTEEQNTSAVDNTVPQKSSHPLLVLFGFAKAGSTHAEQPEYVMARTLMRNPNARTRENMQQIHSSMKEKFAGMSDESIDWLLGGSREMSRAGFADVSEFREFLKKDPKDIPSSRLITGIETIATAIGYRTISANWTEAPHTPHTPEQKKMYEAVQAITKGETVRAIGDIYTQRASDRVNGPAGNNIILCEQDPTVSNSYGPKNEGQPRVRIPTAQFNVTNTNGGPTWIAEAKDNGVNVRNHVSGTAPLCMAAISGLLRGPDETQSSILNKDDEARDLFTTVLLPQFLRSDFHSLAETQAGIDHYIAEQNHNRGYAQSRSRVMSPQVAQQRAIEAMCNASSDSDEQGLGITPYEAMKDFSKTVLPSISVEYPIESGEGYMDVEEAAFRGNAKLPSHQLFSPFINLNNDIQRKNVLDRANISRVSRVAQRADSISSLNNDRPGKDAFNLANIRKAPGSINYYNEEVRNELAS